MTPAPARAPSRPAPLLGWMANLADPTRLRILRVLEREELSVQELCGVLRLPQSTVSRHLKTLSDQGWLASRREGTQSFYGHAPSLDDGARRLWRLARAESDGWAAAAQDAERLEARLEARRSESERFFAGAAAEWDRVRSEAYGGDLERALLAALPSPDWTVADLGCGTGTLARELARSGARVVGIDRSAAMLREARRRTRGLANVELHQASLEALPVPDRACDLALLLLALSYVDDVEPVLREAHRILAPGGRVVLVDARAHADEPFRRRLGQARPGIDAAWLADALSRAGFEAVATEPLPPAPGAGPDLFLARGTRPRRRG